MIALISDIHANFEALCTVMGDIRTRKADSVICLGDIVGYGPDPEKCADLVMQEARHTIMGNHDFALLNAPLGFNPLAAEVIRKTQKMMRPGSEDEARITGNQEHFFYSCSAQKDLPRCLVMEHSKPERWKFLQKLPEVFEQGNLMYVHGSPLDPVFEYVFPDAFETGWVPERIKEILRTIKRICFCGHTHIPCAIDSDLRCIYPKQCGYTLYLDADKKYIINTGSVGQPRDRDNRACYLLFDEKNKVVNWIRLEYDIQAVINKSNAMCGTGNWCGARLKEGK